MENVKISVEKYNELISESMEYRRIKNNLDVLLEDSRLRYNNKGFNYSDDSIDMFFRIIDDEYFQKRIKREIAKKENN